MLPQTVDKSGFALRAVLRYFKNTYFSLNGNHESLRSSFACIKHYKHILLKKKEHEVTGNAGSMRSERVMVIMKSSLVGFPPC